jgi:hypothetical protein
LREGWLVSIALVVVARAAFGVAEGIIGRVSRNTTFVCSWRYSKLLFLKMLSLNVQKIFLNI